MTHLTETQETKLIQVIRDQQAKLIKKEKALLRQGVTNLAGSNNTYQYIERKKVTVYSIAGDLCFTTITAEKEKALQGMNKHCKGLTVSFDIEDSGSWECSDCGSGESVPSVEVYYYQYTFKNLALVKRNVNGLINRIVSDAKFKFTHQYKGKDVRRYLKLIEEKGVTNV